MTDTFLGVCFVIIVASLALGDPNVTDILFLGLLLLVAGSLVWFERSRLFAPEGGDADTTVIGGAGPGYFWKLARPAGLAPDRAWRYYLAAKAILTVLFAAVAWRMLGFDAVGIFLCAFIGFALPDGVLAFVRRERQSAIRRSLSYFLDLLVSLLQAGLTLEEAFKRAAREGLSKEHPLAEEATQVVQELDLGRDRTAGFQALADRTGVRDLRGLANALSLGLGAGTSVEATLRAQADLARAKRREEGLHRLNMASAQVLLPLVLCAFPVFIVMVFFPLGLKVLDTMAQLSGVLR